MNYKYLLAAGIVCGIVFGTYFVAQGARSFIVAPKANSYETFTFFTATTTTATSTNTSDGGGYLIIAGAKKVTMYFTHGGTATTSTIGAKFSVETTKDGSTWNTFNKLIGADVSSTATSTYTIQGATSTVPVALDLSDDTFYAIRCISTELAGAAATDGEHTCVAAAEY